MQGDHTTPAGGGQSPRYSQSSEKDVHVEPPHLSQGQNSSLDQAHHSNAGQPLDEDVEHKAGESRQSEERDDHPPKAGWDGPNDPENPMNWPLWKKHMVTVMLGINTLVVTLTSSIFSTASEKVAKIYGVSMEVTTLGTSLFVLGFATGPLLWGPASELFGRKRPMFLGLAIFAIFQIPVAVSQNLETILICRYFGGAFGSSPLAIAGAMFADFWDPINRGIAISVFAAAVFCGPTLGPIVGGFIVESSLSWRWTEYLVAILGGFFGVVGWFLIPETFAPVLLQKKAKRLAATTGNTALLLNHPSLQPSFGRLINVYLRKPFAMLAFEPILDLITVYLGFVYGILYLFFTAYPISFQRERGWSPGIGALPFLGLLVGVLVGCCIMTYATRTRFARKMRENHGRVVPEERLPSMVFGGVCLPIGLFWFAWTSNPHISWVPQVLSGIPIGIGILIIFLEALNYIVDVYLMHAASAMAANTFIRSLMGAAFPLFATYMYDALGVPWATSLLAFIAVALIPVPIAFYIWGARIRSWSRHAP